MVIFGVEVKKTAMDIFKNLGLDHWWNILIYVGTLLIAATFFVDITFLVNKHLFGLGLGLFLIGLSNNIAFKHITIPAYGGYWQTKKIIHNWITRLLLFLGAIITIFFFVLIIIKLV